MTLVIANPPVRYCEEYSEQVVPFVMGSTDHLYPLFLNPFTDVLFPFARVSDRNCLRGTPAQLQVIPAQVD
jgi:hypothetical protein